MIHLALPFDLNVHQRAALEDVARAMAEGPAEAKARNIYELRIAIAAEQLRLAAAEKSWREMRPGAVSCEAGGVAG